MSVAALCRQRFSSCCTTTRPPAHFLTRSHRSASPSQGRAAPRGTRAARRPPAEPAPPWRPGQAPPGQEHPLATPSLPPAAATRPCAARASTTPHPRLRSTTLPPLPPPPPRRLGRGATPEPRGRWRARICPRHERGAGRRGDERRKKTGYFSPQILENTLKG